MSLQPGDTLLRCSGQDVTRKGAKGKGRIMMSLPAQLALGKNSDGQLGTLEKADTDNPEFVVTTVEGTYFFPGEFICSTNNYFTISCEPKKRQSICQDVFDRLLVFKEPTFVPATTSVKTDLTIHRDEIIESNESVDKLIGSSQATDSGSGSHYTRYHGCSHLAEPVKVSTEKMLNKLSTIRSAEIEDNDSDSDSSVFMPPNDEINTNRRSSSRSTKSEVKYHESDDNSDLNDDDDRSFSRSKVTKKTVKPKNNENIESKNVLNNSPSKKTKSKKQAVAINLASDSDSDADVAVGKKSTKKSATKKVISDSASKSKKTKPIKRKRESSDDEDDESSEFSDVDDDNDDVLNVSNISGRSSRQRKKINYSQSAHDDEDDEEDVEDIGDSDGSNDRVKVKTKVKKLTSKSTAKSKPKAIDPVETIDLLRSSDEEWDE